MAIIEAKAAAAAAELTAANGSAAVPPNIIALLMQFLTSLLAGCIPAQAAHRRVARGGRLLTRTVEKQAAVMCPDLDPQLVAAAVLDQADTLTPYEWAGAYKEAAEVKSAQAAV